MSKNIKITYKEKEYVLGFSRKSIVALEDKGFVITEAENKVISSMFLLFHGAFLQRQPRVSKEFTDEIFDDLNKPLDLFNLLVEMYSAAVNSITGQTEELKNTSWEVV